MALGFVLINVTPGREREVFDIQVKENNIQEIHPLFGEYDLIAKVTVKSMEDLGDIVFNKIRKIKGVTYMKTLTGAGF
ncbi:MAG: Lrp/AsnC ligand binding domain-containing protein [ANME-2 cluster archaeon]|nr:Lrp/AsnC ligand binding domain-containing protein [ANME-2 cluster archaeon]